MTERTNETLAREMEEKTPMEAVKDDLSGSEPVNREERVGDKLAREMEEKTPMEAVKDDLKGKG